MFTAVKFAEEMGISYPTIVRWLKQGLVPGAEAEETPMGRVWQIPESALVMDRPKAGRPSKKAAAKGEAKAASQPNVAGVAGKKKRPATG